MAKFMKMTAGKVSFALAHNTRETPHPAANTDIKSNLTPLNYSLAPANRGITAKEARNYYKRRLSEVYVYGRRDIITACQWIITAPQDLPQDQEADFFQASYDYLKSLYGEENVIQAIVHYDEGIVDRKGNKIAGKPHLHYIFVPVIENDKYGKQGKMGPLASSIYREKLGANQLINRSALQEFHPNFQRFLDQRNIKATVHSGVTGDNNLSVQELKKDTRNMILTREQSRWHSQEVEETISRW